MPATGTKMGPIEYKPSRNSFPKADSSLKMDAKAPATAQAMMM